MTGMTAESQAVFNLFAGTVNPTPAVREQAEIQLKQVKKLTLTCELNSPLVG